MPVLGCGAEMAKLMDVSDQDVATIEDVIKERLDIGVSQAVAQRHAVDEALAQLAEERSMVMKAVQEQLGFDPQAKEPVFANKPDYREDIPNENWLQGKVDYAVRSPRNEFGVPRMGSITGYFSGNVMVPVRWAKDIPGERGEQGNVRQRDLDAIRKVLKDTGKMPLTERGEEYVPYIEIGYDGKPWVNEGNHRIMAAAAEGWEYIPAEVRYFDGGQRRAGNFSPDNLLEITERVTGEAPAFSNKDQTEKPEFKRWFGDSKVVDADGKPLVVYHGTGADITRFDPAKQDSRDAGFWFANESVYANQYAAGRQGGNVMPVYLSLRNPKIYYDRTTPITPALVEDLKAQGYDGILRDFANGPDAWRYADGQKEFAVFNPTQIKSAIGNPGAFDPENPSIIASNKAEGAIIDRDAAGRARLAIARQSAQLLGRLGGNKILDRLYLKQPSAAVKEQIRQMKIDVQRSLDTAVEIAGEVNNLSQAEREMISGIIEKELATGVIPPQHAIDVAAMMNTAMGRQTDELVRLGLLSQEAADRWRDKYLPRYYEPKLKQSMEDTWASFVAKLNGQPQVTGGIKGKHLRGRGMMETIDVQKLAQWQALGWEIRDGKYDPATSQQVTVWRDYTPAERAKMGEIRDAGFRFVMGYMQTQRDIAMGRMYERLANDPQFSSSGPKDGWIEVPSTKVPGADAYRYGHLAGRWVPKEVMSQLQTEKEMDSEAFRMYKKALAWWKSNKTVMSPVGHMNNFVSNITMAHFAGVSYWDAHKYVGAIKDFVTGSPDLKAARDAGLFLGDLTDADLHRLLPPELKAMLDKIDPASMKALRFVDTVLTFGMRGKMSQAYEFGDKFFKYMIWKDAVANGADPGEAVDHALKFIFNYDDLPLGARKVRDIGMPFFAYTYKAIPALVDTLAARPDRFLLPMGLIMMANAAAYAVAAGGGGDDDSWIEALRKYITDPEFRARADKMEEEERKNLPDWMKGRSSLFTQKNIRMGTDSVTNLPVFLDISRFIPGGDLLDMDANVSGGLPFLQVLTPNNPLLALYSMAFNNKDTFMGKDIVNKSDDSGEAAAKRLDFMWKLATPAIAIGGTMWDKAMQVAAHYNGDELPIPDAIGGSLSGINRDGTPVQPRYVLPSMVGVKARPIDLDLSEKLDNIEKRKTLEELNAQLAKARKYREDLSDRAREKQIERIQKKIEFVKEGLTVDGTEKP